MTNAKPVIDIDLLTPQLLRVDKRYGLSPEEFDAYKGACKAAGCRFDGKNRTWAIPVAKAGVVANALKDAGFDVSPTDEARERVQDFLQEAKGLQKKVSKQFDDALARTEELGLYPFQCDGVSWIAKRRTGILADDMGLGKTVQSLASLPDEAAALVICPASVKGKWQKEVRRWRPGFKTAILKGRKSFRFPEAGEVVITNSELLPGKVEVVDGGQGYDRRVAVGVPTPEIVTYLIADEIHAYKSNKAARTVKFRALKSNVLRTGGTVWGLTGTMLLNRPQELYQVLASAGVEREVFGQSAWPNFLRLFKGRKGFHGGYTFGDPDRLDTPAIANCLRRATLRRLKVDVLEDLPPKTHEIVPLSIFADYAKNQKRLANYGFEGEGDDLKRLLKQFVKKLKEKGIEIEDPEAVIDLAKIQSIDFELLSAIRKALAIVKIPSLIDEVEQYEEQDEPLVVFSKHRAPVDLLAEREGWVSITGSTKPELRTEINDGFQAGRYKGIALTIGAGKEGIDLFYASNMLFVDLEWTPALNSQAEDRIYRIGQDRGCLIKILTADHVVDNRVNELLVHKQNLIDATVDASAVKGRPYSSKTARKPAPAPEPVEEAPEVDTASALLDAETKPKPAPRPKKFRQPVGEQEEWAARGLRHLVDHDQDRAAYENSVGFNRIDGDIGHSFAEQLESRGGLTDKQWNRALRFLKKYHRQIGPCPEAKEGVAV